MLNKEYEVMSGRRTLAMLDTSNPQRAMYETMVKKQEEELPALREKSRAAGQPMDFEALKKDRAAYMASAIRGAKALSEKDNSKVVEEYEARIAMYERQRSEADPNDNNRLRDLTEQIRSYKMELASVEKQKKLAVEHHDYLVNMQRVMNSESDPEARERLDKIMAGRIKDMREQRVKNLAENVSYLSQRIEHCDGPQNQRDCSTIDKTRAELVRYGAELEQARQFLESGNDYSVETP